MQAPAAPYIGGLVNKPSTDGNDLTLFLCGPSKCDHDYSKEEEIVENGKVVGGTAVCVKCGRRAIDEANWI